MLRHFAGLATALAALTLLPVARAQTAPPAKGPGGGGGQGTRQQPAPAAGGENENIHLDGWERPQGPIKRRAGSPALPRSMTYLGFGSQSLDIGTE